MKTTISLLVTTTTTRKKREKNVGIKMRSTGIVRFISFSFRVGGAAGPHERTTTPTRWYIPRRKFVSHRANSQHVFIYFSRGPFFFKVGRIHFFKKGN